MAFSKPGFLAEVIPISTPGLAARSDDELLLLTRSGRTEAFDVLVRRHQASALRLAARFLGSAAAARDACQNAFLELFRALPRYRPQGSFVFYLRRILLNQCRMLSRSTTLRERAAEQLAAEPAPSSVTPDELLLERERQRNIERATAQLSVKLREVVALRYAGGHSLDEVAKILEVPIGTVKSRLSTAMKQLEQELGAPP
jgi:RNA polymerase sigma-70 factor (ECF subfamily)